MHIAADLTGGGQYGERDAAEGLIVCERARERRTDDIECSGAGGFDLHIPCSGEQAEVKAAIECGRGGDELIRALIVGSDADARDWRAVLRHGALHMRGGGDELEICQGGLCTGDTGGLTWGQNVACKADVFIRDGDVP